jgi:hypothetical protein
VLTEVSSFGRGQDRPLGQLISYFDEFGFDLYDIAAIAGRTRDNRLRQADFLFMRRRSPLAVEIPGVGRWWIKLQRST